jgi:glucose/arabinose dehydrogenase
MRRVLILFSLTLPACGGSSIISATSTAAPLSPPETAPALSTESQSPVESPVPSSPTAVPPTNAGEFPHPGDYEWRLIASGLNRPVDIQSARDGSGRLFIIEKYGVIRIYEDGQLLAEPFLNIDDRVNDRGNEMGLLGLAFHPDYDQNGYFYVNYTGVGGHTFISRFQAQSDIADPLSEKILLTVNQPFPNHNGGAVVFGPDGLLYLGLGDGGAGGDPMKHGQNPSTLLGSILRIDVDNGDPYAIPADNPFGNEVWAFGLRNPWRISFDRATGDLWIGDVGQNQYEEINYLPAGSPGGANFGWSIMEGSHDYDGGARDGLLLPAAEYSHDFGCSVTGGYVYRGSMPEWNGVYLYGDYCSGIIWGLILSNGQWQPRALFEAGVTITSFGEDEAGELYFASDDGGIYIFARK